MKRIIISAVLLFSVMICQAQWSKRATVELSVGGSFPVGDFGYSLNSYAQSGYAERGVSLAVSFNYRVDAHLGLLASVSERWLGVDEVNLAAKYWIPDYGWDWTWTVEASCWRLNSYMGGIEIILPVYKSDFLFRFLGGFTRTRFPGLTGSGFNFQREATTDMAAAWSAGAGFNFQNFDKITLSLMFDFFSTYPILEEVWSSDLESNALKIDRNILLINLTLGLGLRIF